MDEWHDPRFKPGLQRLDKSNGIALVIDLVLFVVVFYSAGNHGAEVALWAAAAAMCRLLFIRYHASSMERDAFIETTWRFIRQDERLKQKDAEPKPRSSFL